MMLRDMARKHYAGSMSTKERRYETKGNHLPDPEFPPAAVRTDADKRKESLK